MSERKTVDINTTVNYITTQVKKNIEDRKTTIFIVLTAINIFLWGLLLSAYRDSVSELETLQDKHDLTQVMINKYVRDKNE